MTLSAKIIQDIYYSIEISENFGKENKFNCIGCNEPLTFHRNISGAKIQHWNHKTSCKFETEPETKEHINMKKWCYENLVAIKKYKPDSIFIQNQKPDILLEDKGTLIAVEVQHSKISFEKLVQRTMDYSKKNIFVLWLLDENNYSMERKSVIKKFLHRLYFGRIYFLAPYNLKNPLYAKHGFGQWTSEKIIKNFQICLSQNNEIKIARFYDKAWWIK